MGIKGDDAASVTLEALIKERRSMRILLELTVFTAEIMVKDK
jgi:hypothetical protein